MPDVQPTNNPVPSDNPADARDNFKRIDEVVNSTENLTSPTRTGVQLVTLHRYSELVQPNIDGATAAATAAAASAAAAEAAVSGLNYQGLWPDTGGSANKGDTYQTQASGTPTGLYFTALQNTTVNPSNDDVNWREVISIDSLSQRTDIAYMASSGSSAIDNMLSAFNSNPLMFAIGTYIKTGGTTFEYLDSTGPITLDNFRALNAVCLTDLGAVGGDATLDTAAFIAAFALDLPIYIPPTSFDSPYIISGDIDLPLTSTVFGDGPVVASQNLTLLQSSEQAYISFANADSKFTGGSGAEDRAFMYWSNVVFLSSAGLAGKVGTAIGRRAGETASAMGGYCTNLAFIGFEDGWINDWAYFLDIEGLDLINNNRGITFDNWNSSSIARVFGHGGTDHYIDTGGDSARSVLRDMGFNMTGTLQVAVKCDSGVSFEGYHYFESFGSAPTGQAAILYSASQFSGRAVNIADILIDNASGAMDYGVIFNSRNDVETFIPGGMKRVRFAGAFGVAKVAYGVGGFDKLVMPIDVDSCPGLTAADLDAGGQLSTFATRPLTSTLLPSTGISGSSFVTIPLDGSTTLTDNVDAFSTVTGRYRVRMSGYYKISAHITVTATSDLRSIELQLRNNSTLITSALESITAQSGGTSYANMSLEAIVPLNRADTVDLVGRNGDTVFRGSFNCEYISQGQ